MQQILPGARQLPPPLPLACRRGCAKLSSDRNSFALLSQMSVNVNELDREYIRYFSYRSHYNGRFPCETDEKYSKRQSLYVSRIEQDAQFCFSRHPFGCAGHCLRTPKNCLFVSISVIWVGISTNGMCWSTHILMELIPHSDPTLSALTKENPQRVANHAR